MAQIFWRRSIKRRTKNTISALPDLPADLDDNVFIALGTQAAEADKNSKAYDEFLFSEDGYQQMPYEDSVDQILALQKKRTPERQGRAEIPIRMRIAHLSKMLETKRLRVAETERRIAETGQQIADEYQYLSGEIQGEEKGNWEGVPHDTTSRAKHVSNVLKEWLVFILVAGADATVVYFSIYSIMPRVYEALMFSAPAIGVQILFPHLTGKAMANYKANKESNAQDFWIALGIGLSWFAYVLAMSILRFELLKQNYANTHKLEPQMPLLLQFAAGLFTFLILIGLGSWVLIRSMKVNPHKQKMARLTYFAFRKNSRLQKEKKKLAKVEAELEIENKKLEVIQEHWAMRSTTYDQVGESAKSVYRRALVNQLGTPEFTKEYLPESKFKLKKPRLG